VLVKARQASDLLGATKMDRPEWIAVDPRSGEVYCTLTGNAERGAPGRPGVDAANPRAGNVMGHIVRWKEEGDFDADRFSWTHFVLAGDPRAARVEARGDAKGDAFACPDGLWFDARGTLWIQTDMGHVGDGPGRVREPRQQRDARRRPAYRTGAALPGGARRLRDHRRDDDARPAHDVRQRPAPGASRRANAPTRPRRAASRAGPTAAGRARRRWRSAGSTAGRSAPERRARRRQSSVVSSTPRAAGRRDRRRAGTRRSSRGARSTVASAVVQEFGAHAGDLAQRGHEPRRGLDARPLGEASGRAARGGRRRTLSR
jgi:hypothetical protein